MPPGITPELAEVVLAAVEAQLGTRHTAMPGQVTAVHASSGTKRQFVDVRPCIRNIIETDLGELGTDPSVPFREETLPLLPRVPVAFPQGGGFFVSLPLQVGDFVLIVFAERSIDRWLTTARKSRQATISPGDIGQHTLDGAIALPLGPAPLGELLEGVSGTDLVLGHVSGTPLLSMGADGTVTLHGSLVVSGEVTAGASNPSTQVALTTHKHNSGTGPTTPPLPPTP